MNTSSLIDVILKAQKRRDRLESERVAIMQIPSGEQLLRWSARVRATWWYKVFSKLSPSIRELGNR